MCTLLLLCRVQIIACVVIWQTRLGSRENIPVNLASCFPTFGGVTVRRNLFDLPLLRPVNNSDIWMKKAWEWREASHVVWTHCGAGSYSLVHCWLLIGSPNIICNKHCLWGWAMGSLGCKLGAWHVLRNVLLYGTVLWPNSTVLNGDRCGWNFALDVVQVLTSYVGWSSKLKCYWWECISS